MWPVRPLRTFFLPRLKDRVVISHMDLKTLFLFEVELGVGKGEMPRELNDMNAQFPAQSSGCDYVWIVEAVLETPEALHSGPDRVPAETLLPLPGRLRRRPRGPLAWPSGDSTTGCRAQPHNHFTYTDISSFSSSSWKDAPISFF